MTVVAFDRPAIFVYEVIFVSCLLAAALPIRWSLAVLLTFSGVAGFLKDLADYAIVAHLGDDLVLMSALGAHVVRASYRRRPLLPRSLPLRAPLLLLVGSSAVLSVVPSTTPIQALGGWKAYVMPAFLLLMVADGIRRPTDLRPSIGALIAIAIINGLAALYEVTIGRDGVAAWGSHFAHNVTGNTLVFDEVGNNSWRPFGLSADAGAAGLLEVLGAAVLIRVALGRHQPVARLASLLAAAFLVSVSMISGVRAATVALGAGILVAALLSRSRPRNGLVVAALSIPVMGWVTAQMQTFLPVALQVRMLGLFDPATYLVARGGIVVYISNVAQAFPLGVGMGKAVPASDLLSRMAGAPTPHYTNENMLLAMMLELGWLGALFLGMTWWSLGRAAWKVLRVRDGQLEPDIAVIVCVVLFVVGLAGAIFASQPTNLMTWIFGGAIVSLLSQHQEVSKVLRPT